MRNKAIRFSFYFLIIAITGVFLYHISKNRIIRYLCYNHPVDSDILVVEGWVSGHTLDLVAREYEEEDYKLILTTGLPMEPYYLMSEDGFFEFDLRHYNTILNPGDKISIQLKGSAVGKIYPHFKIFLNESTIAENYATGRWKDYSYIIDTAVRMERISISFENDAFFGEEDRNLYIGSLTIPDTVLPARSSSSFIYDQYDINRQDPSFAGFQNVAEVSAYSLTYRGVPENSIIILPALPVKINRTYSSARSVSQWFDSSLAKKSSINIYTENIHSRRTWLIYKNLLKDKGVDVGILSTPLNNDVGQNNKINNLNILSELTAILFYKTYFSIKKVIG